VGGLDRIDDWPEDVILDLDLVLKALGSMALLGLGALITYLLERRPRLLVYYGHVAAFQLGQPESGSKPVGVNTHSVVIRNAGRATAHNVRVPHWGLLANNVPPISVSVFPPVATTREVAEGREAIVISALPPGQLVTLSYLYFPPITFNLINMPISSDEVLAKQVLVLPTRQPPRWWVLARSLLVAVGIAALLYGLFLLRQWLQVIYVASP
jgi:hypothetical protein